MGALQGTRTADDLVGRMSEAVLAFGADRPVGLGAGLCRALRGFDGWAGRAGVDVGNGLANHPLRFDGWRW